jgi:hypothetical protein
VYCALTPEHTPLLRREHAQRLAAGLDGRWPDEAALRRLARLDSTGAIRTTGNAQTFGFLAARLLLVWCRGDRSTDHELFAFRRL